MPLLPISLRETLGQGQGRGRQQRRDQRTTIAPRGSRRLQKLQRKREIRGARTCSARERENAVRERDTDAVGGTNAWSEVLKRERERESRGERRAAKTLLLPSLEKESRSLQRSKNEVFTDESSEKR